MPTMLGTIAVAHGSGVQDGRPSPPQGAAAAGVANVTVAARATRAVVRTFFIFVMVITVAELVNTKKEPVRRPAPLRSLEGDHDIRTSRPCQEQRPQREQEQQSDRGRTLSA